MISLLKERVLAYERRLITEALMRADGVQLVAARALGIHFTTLSKKLNRSQEEYPDDRWNDAPLAWAVRREVDRVVLAPCWTRDDITADAQSPETIALVVDEGAARLLVKNINTTIAVRAAIDAETIELACELA